MGDHSGFDFWPPRKEVVVPSATPVDVLAAINAHAITRLAVPALAPAPLALLEDGPHTAAEQQSARERITSCFAYDPSGLVDDADVEVSTADRRLLENLDATLDLARIARKALLTARSVDTRRWASRVLTRAGEVPDEVRRDLRRARRRDGSSRTESYRRLTVDVALGMIAALGR
ncbi:hypothetical protein JCM18899A_06520 [Nocardioides sp. AN3]